MHYLVRILIFLLGISFSFGVMAEDKKIELKQALELNKELDSISLDIIRIDSLSMLEDVAKDLEKIKQQATLCVTQMEKELAEIESQLKKVISLESELPPEISYLKEKQQSIKQILSQCRLADLRVRDLDSAVSEQIEQKFFSQLFRYNDPLWKKFPKGFDDITQLKKSINGKVLLNTFDYEIINSSLWAIVASLIILGVMIGVGIRIKLSVQCPVVKNKTFFNHLMQCGRKFLIRNAYLLIPLTLTIIFFSILSMVYQQWLTINLLGFVLLGYALFAMLTRLMFYPGRPFKAILRIPKRIGKHIYWILQSIAWILIIDYTLDLTFPSEVISENLLKITNAFFVISIAILLFVLCIRVMQIPYLKVHYRWLIMTIGSTVSFGLIMVLLMEIVGLHYFAQHILIGLLSTLGLTLLAWNIYQIIKAGLGIFSDENSSVNRKVRQWFGAKRQRQLPEIFTLKLALNILLWGSLLIVLFNIWGLPETDYKKILDTIFSGFTIGKLPIYPMRIVWSL
ncbi:MAG: hypothetical protein GKR77_06830, partial [Legionellales bacterium]|nr:hypothetical protein [Legionellales bacterium]